jgi:hypothetical protein
MQETNISVEYFAICSEQKWKKVSCLAIWRLLENSLQMFRTTTQNLISSFNRQLKKPPIWEAFLRLNTNYFMFALTRRGKWSDLVLVKVEHEMEEHASMKSIVQMDLSSLFSV